MFRITRSYLDNPNQRQLNAGVNADTPLSDHDHGLLVRAACQFMKHGWQGVKGKPRCKYWVQSDGAELSVRIEKRNTKKEQIDLRYFRCVKADVLAYCEEQEVA